MISKASIDRSTNSTRQLRPLPAVFWLVFLTPGLSTSAMASGFAVQSQAATSIANGHAGAARAADASVALSNSALATKTGDAWSISLGGIVLGAKFKDQGSLSAVGTAASGRKNASADGAAPLLSVFHTRKLSDRSALAFAMYTPFGLSTTYDNDWVGRYQVQKAELKTLALNPSYAYQFNDQFSGAIGASIVRGQTKLVSAVDFGSLCFALIAPAACGSASVLPQTQDGRASIEAAGWGYGWTAALAWQVHDALRLGLNYRSTINLNVDGDAEFRNPSLPGPFAALTQSPATSNGKVESKLALPELLTLGMSYNLSPQTELIADYTWSRWSRLDALTLEFGNVGAADSVIPFNWNNTSKFGAGVNHQVSGTWTARAGLEWEGSAVKDDLRNPIVPDSDRRFIGMGARYQMSDAQSLDFALGTIRFARASIDRSVLGAGRLRGDYALDSYHFAVQYNW